MADDIDQLVQEIEEDLRQEKYMKLWKQYGNHIIAVMLVLVVGVAGHSLWKNYQTEKKERTSDMFIGAQELVEKGEVSQALGVLAKTTTEGHRSYSMLSKFQRAALYARPGGLQEPQKAIEEFRALSKDESLPKRLQNLALLLAIGQESSRDGGLSAETLLAEVEPLTDSASAWRYSALEMKGALLLKLDRKDEAAEIFADLVRDKKSPKGVQMRAQILAQTLAYELED